MCAPVRSTNNFQIRCLQFRSLICFGEYLLLIQIRLGGNVSNLYLEGVQIGFRPGHGLSSPKTFFSASDVNTA